MSILDTFDDSSEAILHPSHFAPSPLPADFPETVIVTFRQEIIDLVPTLWGGTPVHCMKAGRDLPIYRVEYNGKALGIYHTLVGAAGSAGLLDEAHALGGKRFLVFGSCGTLDQSITAGHFILPTAAYRDEGVSYHYLPAADFVDVPTAGALRAIFDALELPCVMGKNWTTDALYRETRKNMALRRQAGCISVDMECAALQAVAAFRGFPVYQFLYAEDNLDSEAWERRTMGHVAQSTYERYLEIAFEVASRL